MYCRAREQWTWSCEEGTVTNPATPLLRETPRFGQMVVHLALAGVFHHHEHSCRVMEPAVEPDDIWMPWAYLSRVVVLNGVGWQSAANSPKTLHDLPNQLIVAAQGITQKIWLSLPHLYLPSYLDLRAITLDILLV